MSDGGQSTHRLEELRAERLAALNLMEDAIAARRELERANAALRASEEQQAFLLKFSDAIRPLANPAEIKTTATRVLGERFGASRVVYGEIDSERDGLTISGGYFAGASRLPDRLRISDFAPSLLAALQAGRKIVVSDALIDPSLGVIERARFAKFGTRAAVALPLVKGGCLVALLAIHHLEPHAWSSEELSLIAEAAERTWAAVESARAEEALRANEEQFRRAIEDAPIPVIMHAEDGQVLQLSRAWTELTGYHAKDIPTFKAWLSKADTAGANRVREHVRRLFSGLARSVNEDIEFTTRGGERRRWAFSASAPGTLLDGRRYIVGMAVDVTERVEEMRAANKELHALSKRLVVAQEDERAHLARELHDEVGQQLTGLNMLLHRHSHSIGSKTIGQLKDIREAARVVSELLQRVRKMSVDLRPPTLDDLGLALTVRGHLDSFSKQTGIRVRLHGGELPEKSISPEARITAFRVIQEALTNVARHARTKSAMVTMLVRMGKLHLSIKDAGRGFSLRAQEKKRSSGLTGMRERVALSGGQFSIESAPRRGTRVAVTLPLSGFEEKR